MCRVKVSVLSGSVILLRSQLLGYTVGWKRITDKKVMEGSESKRALQYTTLILYSHSKVLKKNVWHVFGPTNT